MVLDKIKTALMTALNIFILIFGKLKVIAPKSNINQRIISSVIMLLIAVYAIYFSKGLFFLMAIALTILVTVEWLEIIKTAKDQNKWRLIGFVYILVPVWAIVQIRDIDANVLLWMFFIIWTTDISAYFVGKSFGGKKLALTISPNKTWSGLIGGVVASMIIGFLSSFMFVTGNIIFFVVISGALAVIEQLSDLVESKIKRIFQIKDSGNIIPGHGGLLDRMDGITLVAPTVLIMISLFSSKFY
jgi:phosphatidate cytidylyltransferase